jgi:integrase
LSTSETIAAMRRTAKLTVNGSVAVALKGEALRVTAGIAEDRKGWLFRTALSERSMNQSGSLVAAAGITAEIGCHTFRATGITAYLANGGARGRAGKWRAHESPGFRSL